MIDFEYETTDLGDTLVITVYADAEDEAEAEAFGEGKIEDLAALEEYAGVDNWDVVVVTE